MVEELVGRGGIIVIPEGRHQKNDMELRDGEVDIGHSAHQGVDATKRQLRVRLWFPGMDRAVERRVSTCLPCIETDLYQARTKAGDESEGNSDDYGDSHQARTKATGGSFEGTRPRRSEDISYDSGHFHQARTKVTGGNYEGTRPRPRTATRTTPTRLSQQAETKT